MKLQRQLELLAVLLDGKGRTIEAFSGVAAQFGVSRRVLLRDLESLAAVAKFQIAVYRQYEQDFWRCDMQLKRSPGYTEKRCLICNQTKPVAEFYHNSSHRDGRSARCASCSYQTLVDWRRKNQNHVNAYQHSYYQKHRAVLLEQAKDRRASKKRRNGL